MDCTDSTLVTRALGASEAILMPPVVALGCHRLARAERRQRLQAKIDTDFAVSSRPAFNLELKADIPTPACVLGETAAFGVFRKRSALVSEPAKSLAKIDHAVTVKLTALLLEWQPTERTARTETRPKARSVADFTAIPDKLLTDSLHTLLVDTKLSANAIALLRKIKMGGPLARRSAGFPTSFHIALLTNAPIPHLVDRDRVRIQSFCGAAVFEAVFVG